MVTPQPQPGERPEAQRKHIDLAAAPTAVTSETT